MNNVFLNSIYTSFTRDFPQDMRNVSQKNFVEVARFIDSGLKELFAKDRKLAAWLKAYAAVEGDISRTVLDPYNANTPKKFKGKFGGFLPISTDDLIYIFGTISEERYLASNTVKAEDGSKMVAPDKRRAEKIINLIAKKLKVFEKEAAVKIDKFLTGRLKTKGTEFTQKVFALAASKIHSNRATGVGSVFVAEISDGLYIGNAPAVLASELFGEINKSGINIKELSRKKTKIRKTKGKIQEMKTTILPNGGGKTAGAADAKKAGAGRKMRRAAGNVTVPKTEVPRAAEAKAADAKMPEVRARRIPKAKI